MPTSELTTAPYVINLVRSLKVNSILDVGCGFGKYGFLFREYLEVWKGNYLKKDWVIKIDALEVFKKYLTPVHKYIYNKIIVGDVRTTNLSGYDLLFFGDVLEHLEKKEALDIIRKCIKGSHVIITTPNGFVEQGSYNGNDYEIHKSGFSSADFKQFNGQCIVIGLILVVFIKCQA